MASSASCPSAAQSDAHSATSQIEYIRPVLPHALSHHSRQFLLIPPTDLRFEVIHLMWVVPGPIDLELFKRALGMVLSDYPHCAGRLARGALTPEGEPAAKSEGERPAMGPWRIDLTNGGVELSIATTNHPGVFTEGYNDLDHDPDFYVDIECPEPDFTGVFPFPLTKVRLTKWEQTGFTSFTLAQSHVLDDGPAVLAFPHFLSQYYLALKSLKTIQPLHEITFERYFRSPHSLETRSPELNAHLPDYMPTALPYLGFLAVDYPHQYILNRVQESMDGTERVDLKFSRDQLQGILQHALGGNQANELRISKTDAVAAYIITLVQRTSKVPISQVQQTFGYRGAKTPKEWENPYIPPPNTSAGNCFMVVSSKEPLTGSESIREIASILRRTINELRHPETFQKVYAIYSHVYDRIQGSMHFPMEYPIESGIQVNTVSKLPVLEAHFGYPGRVRMYSWDSYENFIELLPANPVQLPQGKWLSFDGGVDVHFRVRRGVKLPLLKLFKEDMRRMCLEDPLLVMGMRNRL
ncbi:hypothetical protein BDZ97DRAFT_2076907 [Flammula alnicola]|nr:hypothetical protein BDZ97DRAFT_2076907 [Flammula alnicola]